MEKIKTTLHPKDSPNDELYPNVLPSNIPVAQGLINTEDKLSIDNTYVQEKLTTGVGINIDGTKIGIADSVSKQVEFSQGVKTSKIVDTNGYSYLTSDTSYINIGNSSRLLQTYGSGSRPTYNGKDLALLSDSNTSYWNLLMANLGIGRWAGQRFYRPYTTDNTYTLFDNLSTSYTSLIRCFSKISLYDNYSGKIINNTTIICPDLPTIYNDDVASFMFSWWEENSNITLMLGNGSLGGQYIFGHSPAFSKIDVQEGKTFQITNYSQGIFSGCTNLEYIGPIDMSLATQTNGGNAYMFQNCTKLKTIKITHWKASFNISFSTAFEESDLVEILNNLDTVSTTQTLDMGTTNLAKLTTDDILIATGKGWQLA